MVKKSDSLILGDLDKHTRLVATQNSFVIKEQIKTSEGAAWVGKYYYTELGDAIRGYVKHKLRNPDQASSLDGNIKSLISVIDNLENTIKDIGIKLTQAWTVRMQDPVESHLFKSSGDRE